MSARNHIWEAYDQGRIGHANGLRREQNPHIHPALGWHINIGDWFREWDAEAERAGATDD